MSRRGGHAGELRLLLKYPRPKPDGRDPPPESAATLHRGSVHEGGLPERRATAGMRDIARVVQVFAESMQVKKKKDGELIVSAVPLGGCIRQPGSRLTPLLWASVVGLLLEWRISDITQRVFERFELIGPPADPTFGYLPGRKKLAPFLHPVGRWY